MAHVYNSQLDAYTLYHKTQESSSPTIGPALPALGHALAGSIGTAISNLSIYPLDLIITRLQVQRSLNSSSTPTEISSRTQYTGVIDAFEKIYEKEGLAGFYTGVLQDTGKSIADSFLFFLFYNYLRSSRLKKHGTTTTTLPVLDELAVGALAGACSKVFTTPISNIVTRKQTSSMLSSPSSPSSSSVSSIAEKIRSEKGLQGFWSGYSASLVLTLNPSITFFLYEFFKRTFLPRSRREEPGARITFLMAAFSKSIASTITYPFSLAKARAQMSSKPPVDEASVEKVKTEVENAGNKTEAEKAGKDAKNVARRSTVFHTIVEIYKKEGAAALYEGVLGEIFKGFFSHGITMIVKESIHKLIIQTYFLILKTLDKYPSPSELAKQAGDAMGDASTAVGEKISDAGQAVKLGYVNATENVAKGVESGKDAVGIAAERVGVVSSNTTEAAKTANEYASKEAGHLLGNAQEMLGGKIEEVGKGIKGKKE